MELFKILGIVAIDNQEANKAMDDTTEKAEQSHSKISGAFDKIGSAAVKVGKVMATGLAAGAAAFTALMKQSMDSYGEYEQLIGGSELMFGEGFDFIADKAKTAYKDVQMSQNDYLKQVNGFAVGLKTALSGDGQAAAELSAKIIKAEADIIAATGNTQEAVQNAFNGIMKSNFTMLDNLGLGITPTKEGFQEVIDKVNEWNEANGNATSYMIDNLADCQAALVDYVEMQGMADYASNESAKTIQGSMASMKAAWTNFLTGMADDTQDFDTLLGNLIDSVVTVANNLIPRIQMLLPRLVDGLNQLITTLLPYIPEIIETLLPGIIEGGTALLTGLIVALPQILQILLEQIPFILEQIGIAMTTAFPVLLNTVKNLFVQIWDYIAVELLGTSANFESTFKKVKEVFNNAWSVIQHTWNTVGKPIFDMVKDAVEIVKNAFAERMPEIKEFVSTCFADIKVFWENNLKPCFEAIGNFIENILAPIFKTVFETNIKGTISTVFNAIKSLWNNTLKPVFTGITDFLTGVFTLNWRRAWEGVKSILKGVLNGVITGIETMINGAINAINGLINGINALIGKAGDLLGLEISIPTIRTLSLPKLEEGGVLEKGQVGLLEGNGAEAVVPLERNKAWISAVAEDMRSAGIGGGDVLIQYMQQLIEMLAEFFPQLLEAAGHDIVTNDGAILARYAPLLNVELGRISNRKDRGR